MKCIHCTTENNYKDRQSLGGSRCKKCLHPFAFEPKTDGLTISDTFFEKAIKDVSADGTLSFTSRQLWYELNRRLLARKTLSCGAPILLILIGAGALSHFHHTLLILLIVPLLTAATTVTPAKRKPAGPRYPKLPFDAFEMAYLRKWIATHGAIAKLLPATASGSYMQEPGATRHGAFGTTSVDAAGYSFDRALITEHADIAEMLVANNFHFENNCAILSLDGYPFGKAPTIMTMLARNPNLKVFALHDATIVGSQMGHKLRESAWFPDTSIRIIDLGLRPLNVLKGSMIALSHSPVKFPVGGTSTSLTAEEIAWLEAGNTAELHALRPNRLMRGVYQGFSKANQTDAGRVGDDGIILVDTGPSIWIYDSGMDVYAADSFG